MWNEGKFSRGNGNIQHTTTGYAGHYWLPTLQRITLPQESIKLSMDPVHHFTLLKQSVPWSLFVCWRNDIWHVCKLQISIHKLLLLLYNEHFQLHAPIWKLTFQQQQKNIYKIWTCPRGNWLATASRLCYILYSPCLSSFVGVMYACRFVNIMYACRWIRKWIIW